MKRLIYILFLCATACGGQAQLLYKISGNGLERPSYIVGTYHLEDARFVGEIPGAEQALAAVEQVCGEVPFVDMFDPDSAAMMKASMYLPGEQTIKDVLTPKQLKQLNKVMVDLCGLPFTNRFIFIQMGQLTPAALETTLLLMLYMKENPNAFDPTNGLDNYFQKSAHEQGKPVIGLETVSLQVQTLYQSEPIEEQTKTLMTLVKNPKKQMQLLTKIEGLYRAQDMAGLENFLKKGETPPALLENRNANWLQLMPTIMAEHSTLFAVGAAHLPGKKGVLQMLREAGYTVEAVTE